jgi:regulator of RNase E activity RraB
MTKHTNTPVALATCVEQSLHMSLDGFDLKRARLYGISVVDAGGVDRLEDGALRITFLAEHGDVYELIDAPTSAIVRMFDAAVVLTCGWAAPIDRSHESGDNDDADDDDDDAKFRQASILNVAEYDSLWWLETMAWDRYCDLLIRPKRL